MNWTRLPDGRSYLPQGTILKFEYQGGCYKILGAPIGYGGAGILYPAVHVTKKEDGWKEDGMWVALKECYPHSTDGMLDRKDSGEIYCVEKKDTYSAEYYASAKVMMRREKEITGQIFNKGFRLTPLWDIMEQEEISLDGKNFQRAENQYGIMERLDEKGTSLGGILKEQPGGCLTAYQSVCILQQILQAIEEVHSAGYLHGDIQENNIFLKGTDFAQDEEGIVTLIDFGSARELLEDGATAMIFDKKLYSTSGYSAPECMTDNDGTLRLTKAADIYSVSYLMLRMLVGKTMDTKALQLVVNGKYLYPRQAKKIGCPSGSIDTINKILQKALQENPRERYQEAGEMLEELKRLERALAPKKSAIASVDYEAFISYCHEEKSIEAAEQIQKMIERYRIPKSVQKLSGKTRMGKVFRDREELASSSDMEVHLKEALYHSEYLIVLLSPKVPESPWVNREIELFLQTHDRDHVLTILVDGELNESFPEYLRKSEKFDNGQMKMVSVESLAADIRGIDKKERKQRLKTEIFRLLAPMLGCGYDDLRQRQKEYRTKRILRFSLAGMVVFGFIAVYVGWQAAQIQKNYWETLTKQSRYLADVSSELLTSGDRIKALQVALEALPESEKDKSKPRTAEAEAALANALYAYQGVDAVVHSVQASYLVEMDSISNEMQELSSDGAWVLTVDDEQTVYVWDTETGSLKRKWDEDFWQQQGIDPTITYIAFLDEDRIFFMTETSMVQISVSNEEILVHKKLSETFSEEILFTRLKSAELSEEAWEELENNPTLLEEAVAPAILDLSENDSLALYAMTENKEYIAVYDSYDGYLAIYSIKNSELVYFRQLGEEIEAQFSMTEENDLAISPDGRYVALSCGELWGVYKEGYQAGYLQIVDTQEDLLCYAVSEEYGYYKSCFTSDGKLAAFSYAPYTMLFENISMECPGQIQCFDLEGEGLLWEMELKCQMNDEQYLGLLADEEAGKFVLWYGQQIQILDVMTGEVQRSPRTEEGIVDIFHRRENNYLVATQDGSLYLLGGDRTFVELGTNVTREINGFLFDDEKFAAYLLSEDGSLVGMHTLLDPNTINVEVGENIYGISTYHEGGGYSARRYGDENENNTIVTMFKSESDEKWFQLETAGMIDKDIILKDQKTYCYVEYLDKERQKTLGMETDTSYKTYIVAYDIEKQEELWRIEPESSWSDINLFQTASGEEVAVAQEDYDYLSFLDLYTGKWMEEKRSFWRRMNFGMSITWLRCI